MKKKRSLNGAVIRFGSENVKVLTGVSLFRVNFCLKETGISDAISRFIERWLEIENYMKEKYAFLADRTDNAQAKTLFNQLSSSGDRHAKILQRIREMLVETGEIDKEVTIHIRVRTPEEKTQKWRTAIEETYHSMKDHLELEAGLKEAYEEISDMIENQEAQKLFRMIAMDEKKHHEMLLAMMRFFERIFKNTLR